MVALAEPDAVLTLASLSPEVAGAIDDAAVDEVVREHVVPQGKLHPTLERIERQMVKAASILLDEEQPQAAAEELHAILSFAPDHPTAREMLPPPPDLSKAAPQWKERELFWIVKNGLKYTGMPAWPSRQRDDEVWAVVAFLRRLPDLDRAVREKIRDLSERRERHGLPPMKFGVAAYAIVRDNEAEARHEVERITNVKQFAAGYQNYQHWLAGKRL